jgi:hypothetical protein
MRPNYIYFFGLISSGMVPPNLLGREGINECLKFGYGMENPSKKHSAASSDSARKMEFSPRSGKENTLKNRASNGKESLWLLGKK